MTDTESNFSIEKCPYCTLSFADKKRWNNIHNINKHINKHPQSSPIASNNKLLTSFFSKATSTQLTSKVKLNKELKLEYNTN